MSFPSESPSKANIQEANKHLQMLHARVNELERELTRQASDFISRDQTRQIHFEELLKLRDAEISQLNAANQLAEENIKDLESKLSEKVSVIEELEDKCRVLDQVLQCKPVLDSMVKLLNVYQSCQNHAHDSSSKSNGKTPNSSPSSAENGTRTTRTATTESTNSS